jgi:hypothetical protein
LQGFFQHLGCAFLGKTTYYSNLKNFVYPCIWAHWLKNQFESLVNVRVKPLPALVSNSISWQSLPEVLLCGDGRFDSPGFTARFCTYFIQV